MAIKKVTTEDQVGSRPAPGKSRPVASVQKPPAPDFALDRMAALPSGPLKDRADAKRRSGAVAFCELARRLTALPEVPRPGFEPAEDGSMQFDRDGAEAVLQNCLATVCGPDADPAARRGFIRALSFFVLTGAEGTTIDLSPQPSVIDYLLGDDSASSESAPQPVQLKRVPPTAGWPGIPDASKMLQERMDAELITFSSGLEEIWQLSEAAIEVGETLDGQETATHARLMGLQRAVAHRLKDAIHDGTARLFGALNGNDPALDK